MNIIVFSPAVSEVNNGLLHLHVVKIRYLLPLQPLLLLLDVQLLSLLSLPLGFSMGSLERLLPLKHTTSLTSCD